jgi:rubrerythrin
LGSRQVCIKEPRCLDSTGGRGIRRRLSEKDNLGKNEDVDYYVCSVCGMTVEKEAPEKCPVCGAAKKAFFKVP